MADARLPTGTVTFLFTDVAASTAMWEKAPVTMGAAMARHDELVESAVAQAGGWLIRPRGEGDSRFAVFVRASDAIAAAVGIQRMLAAEAWSTPRPIRVRIAVHTGETELRDGDYYGNTVNRCARLRSIAHPGQILLSQATVDVAAARLGDGVVLRDMGTHKLRDLTEPERVHQVAYPGLADEFPPPASLDTVTHNLPAELTPLVGRDAEVGEVAARLGSHRLVTLTGPGGSGKTRLAVAVAAEVLALHPDGVWLVELAPLTDPDLVAAAIGGVTGVRQSLHGSILDTTIEQLGAKAVLLVVDNCEHVVDAAAKAIHSLLRGTPNLRVLATSQEPLAIAGERVYPVPPLRLSDAAELFGQAAATTTPSFVIDDTNRDIVNSLCTALDGIPLALQLAAGRTRVMSPAQILDRLSDRFKLLKGGERSAPERHRTLAAAVDWSHDLLTRAEQILYRRLSVFHGGATLEAIEAVCTDADLDADEVVDLVQRLVERSLLVADHTAIDTTFSMLETIRQHARAKLNVAGETNSFRDRHLDWFRSRAEAAYHAMSGADMAYWVAALRSDQHNTRAALAWACSGGEPNKGLELGRYLRLYWHVEGIPGQGADWLERLLHLTAGERSLPRVYALASLARLRASPDADPEVLAAAEQALVMARELADAPAEGFVEYVLSFCDFHDPIAHLESAQRLMPADDPDRAAVDSNMAEAYCDVMRWDDAIRLVEPLLLRAESQGNLDSVQHLSEVYSKAARGVGHAEEALQHAERAVVVARQVGAPTRLFMALDSRIDSLLEIGDYVAAAKDAVELLTIAESVDPSFVRSLALYQAGAVAVALRRSEVGAILIWVAWRELRAAWLRVPRLVRLHERILGQARADLGDERYDQSLRRAEIMTVDHAFTEAAAKLAEWTSAAHGVDV
ncbi:adenylate/guanylate cyclase domain-containing protein [Jatrophihabitans telluris]|uniref:Adenylate/guanylate cyclase domain-containing protein n=1 Tax=Jatrophihabitans telluris TaxID=2038343 RepID=A0ABY4R170_9ACTN|nr:adenylate/guanylate cyclase domain-containing protein [Jatrophihabitans telluris]UQX89519.1 adenylate/guanylate cyclase domain-containing protein [Jatrophihabitans telluris]